ASTCVVRTDELLRERVGVGDEVRARAVERIDERPRLTDERPAIPRPATRDVVAVRAEALEVHHLELLDLLGEVRLVLLEERHHAVERAHLLEAVRGIVHHEADARIAGRERDDPRPIAHTHEVVGRAPAIPGPRRLVPHLRLGRRELRDVDAPTDAEPTRVRVVPGAARELLLAPDERRAPARVDEPAALDPRLVARRTTDARAMRLSTLAEHDLLDAHPFEERDAVLFFDHRAEIVLEPTAIELIGGNDGLLRRADLHPLVDREVTATGIEPKAVLEDLVLLQVLDEPEALEIL